MFAEEKLSQAEGKKQSIGMKSFLTSTQLVVLNMKNCISRLSFKMFIKR